MEGESQQLASPSAAVSKVLDDDDLLIEILLRVTFPTSLVRAALVCKRWLHHASDPAFLGHFRKLHPPRLLGFYIDCASVPKTPCFVPMPRQPPELSAIICRRSFSLDQVPKGRTFIRDCQNGRIVTLQRQGGEGKHGVYSPLFPERGVSIIPQFPCYQQGDYRCWMTYHLFVKECDDLSYFLVLMGPNKEKTKSMVHVCTVRHGESAWRELLTFSTDPLRDYWDTKVVLIDSKIYMPGFPSSSIIVLDLTALSYSMIYLPQGVDYGDVNTMLSRADDASGFYLVQAKELQLRIWVHKGDNWLMVDTISLVEMCATANLRMSDCTGEDEHTIELRIKKVGDNAEFGVLSNGSVYTLFGYQAQDIA